MIYNPRHTICYGWLRFSYAAFESSLFVCYFYLEQPFNIHHFCPIFSWTLGFRPWANGRIGQQRHLTRSPKRDIISKPVWLGTFRRQSSTEWKLAGHPYFDTVGFCTGESFVNISIKRFLTNFPVLVDYMASFFNLAAKLSKSFLKLPIWGHAYCTGQIHKQMTV